MKVFHKEVDTTDRKAMVDFLKSHFRYYTMNSWNRSTAYANNVKIPKLGIEDKEVEDKMYSLAYMSEDTADVFFDVHELIRGFVRDTGYDACFNGRSNGYLVMHEMDGEHVYPGRSIDQDADFDDEDEWSMEALKERVILVSKFDQLCDDILATAVEFCKTHEITTITVTSVSEKQVFVPIENKED